MAFITEKEELKPGLIIFRRGDVKHRLWYCRLKLPNVDRYKTTSLRTSEIDVARLRALEHEADMRLRLKYDVPVFTPSFREIGRKYLLIQEALARQGRVSQGRVAKVRALVEGTLDKYVGPTHVHLIGDELWHGYPDWRRENGAGRNRRNGVRRVSEAMAKAFAEAEVDRRTKARRTLGIRVLKRVEIDATPEYMIPFVSDATIRFELSIFRAILTFAHRKGYVSSASRFRERSRLEFVRRDAFTLSEVEELTAVGQAWAEEGRGASSAWYRRMAYQMIQTALETGMRPSEMKDLRWCDITRENDRNGRKLVVLPVHGKGMSRKLVAPASVGDYLERVRCVSRAIAPVDRVFTNRNGTPATTLYRAVVASLLRRANLRGGPDGAIRSTYCLRHTYAMLRLKAGVDVYHLAKQMGTSVQTIERLYGHVDLVRHAHLILAGMVAMEGIEAENTDS